LPKRRSPSLFASISVATIVLHTVIEFKKHSLVMLHLDHQNRAF
jgi:hypothetical protein